VCSGRVLPVMFCAVFAAVSSASISKASIGAGMPPSSPLAWARVTSCSSRASQSRRAWHQAGWKQATGYEPDGIGYLGLGTLTGCTPEQMRAVPVLDTVPMAEYLGQSAARLIAQIEALGESVADGPRIGGLTPYQMIGATLQGAFAHVGEIDTLIALRSRIIG
jgi:hypothetical protein